MLRCMAIPDRHFRYVCLAPVSLEEPWLCTNIFQSSCTINGKVCSFVVNSGSCHNVIAESAARKLGLKHEEHPEPYKLTWLKQGVKIRIAMVMIFQQLSFNLVLIFFRAIIFIPLQLITYNPLRLCLGHVVCKCSGSPQEK